MYPLGPIVEVGQDLIDFLFSLGSALSGVVPKEISSCVFEPFPILLDSGGIHGV